MLPEAVPIVAGSSGQAGRCRNRLNSSSPELGNAKQLIAGSTRLWCLVHGKGRVTADTSSASFFSSFRRNRPQVISLANGPAIVRSHPNDLQPVGATNPAQPSETLTVFAIGLGPVPAAVDPGQPFPSSPVAPMKSPVEFCVN